MAQQEKEFMGGKSAKMWTYLILFFVIVVAILVANFAFSNPEVARNGVKSFLGLPAWVLGAIALVVGIGIFWLGLKIETDWPEALGAAVIAGAVTTLEIMIGWNKFAFGGMVVIPYVVPLVVFLVLLVVGLVKSK